MANEIIDWARVARMSAFGFAVLTALTVMLAH